MDASQITKLLQKQNTRYINRCQTVDSSTLIWKTQIESSKYIKGVKTCDGSQNWNVPTNPCCANQVVVDGVAQNTGTYSFGGSGRTTALQTGSPQHFLNVLSGASGSASQVYSSESITLQRAGKESCGVPGTNPAPANSYVVLPGGDPATSDSQLQVPSCSYICSNTNGPTPSNLTIGQPGSNSVNNNLNPYLPPFDTYYKFKNPSAQCQFPVQDQNQKHFVKQCHSRFPNANNGVSAVCNPCDNTTYMDPNTKQFHTKPYFVEGTSTQIPPTCDGCIIEPIQEQQQSEIPENISFQYIFPCYDVEFPEAGLLSSGQSLNITFITGGLVPGGLFTIQNLLSPSGDNLSIDGTTGTITTPNPFNGGSEYQVTYTTPSGTYSTTFFVVPGSCA